MDKIYENSKDLHIRKTCIYVKTGNAYAYSDAATTVKIDAATLKDLFQMGIVVIDGNIQYSPVSFKMDAAVGSITYVKTDGTTPTTAVLAELKSSEYIAG
jgi:hypothetical protein